MRISTAVAVLFGVSVMAASAGAVVGSAVLAGGGTVVALGALAVHPTVTAPAVTRPTRLLLWCGLALTAAAILVQVSGWSDAVASMNPAELLAWARDHDRQQEQFLRMTGVAALLGLGLACFAVALTRLPRRSLAGAAGYAAASAGIGVLVLAALFWWTVDVAARARPDPPAAQNPAVGMSVAVEVETGPDLDLWAVVPLLPALGGTALLVVGCGRLSGRPRA